MFSPDGTLISASAAPHCQALEDHEGTVSIEGRTITNLCFADDIDGLAGEEQELAKLVECLDKASTAYSMEISAEKTRLMTNTNGINTEIKVNGLKLETVKSFKYLGSVITDEDSKPEILSRIIQTTAASCKAQWKGEEDKADRGRGGKTTSGNGQAWSSSSPRGQWRTEKHGGNWL